MNEPPDPIHRWTEIERLFEVAVELEPEAREAFLSDIPDDALRLDVRSLLAHHAPDGSFISAAIGHVAGALTAQADAAAAGSTIDGVRIGAYQITGILGQGGMGAVYRARRADGQFEQDVAIKLDGGRDRQVPHASHLLREPQLWRPPCEVEVTNVEGRTTAQLCCPGRAASASRPRGSAQVFRATRPRAVQAQPRAASAASGHK